MITPHNFFIKYVLFPYDSPKFPQGFLKIVSMYINIQRFAQTYLLIETE